ncbi:MAG: hypothetical protein HY444_06960, partial [Nitrospirae bacterium]|nr:hypothetical protein [Nitrospirota bacterium]
MINQLQSKPVAWVAVMFMLALLAVPLGAAAVSENTAGPATETATDVYYKTTGVPNGPPAPAGDASTYPRYGSLDNRTFVWFVTQQHTYFGGFVLALPIFCVIL